MIKKYAKNLIATTLSVAMAFSCAVTASASSNGNGNNNGRDRDPGRSFSGSSSSSGAVSGRVDTDRYFTNLPSATTTTTTSVGAVPVTEAQADKIINIAIQNSVVNADGTKTAAVTLVNRTSIDKNVSAILSKKAKEAGIDNLHIGFDMLEGGKVTERFAFNGAALVNAMDLTMSDATSLKNLFAKNYSNNVHILSFQSKSKFDTSVFVASELPKGMKGENIHIYRTDANAEKFQLVTNDATKFSVDSNNYIHFYIGQGGTYVISEGAIAAK